MRHSRAQCFGGHSSAVQRDPTICTHRSPNPAHSPAHSPAPPTQPLAPFTPHTSPQLEWPGSGGYHYCTLCWLLATCGQRRKSMPRARPDAVSPSFGAFGSTPSDWNIGGVALVEVLNAYRPPKILNPLLQHPQSSTFTLFQTFQLTTSPHINSGPLGQFCSRLSKAARDLGRRVDALSRAFMAPGTACHVWTANINIICSNKHLHMHTRNTRTHTTHTSCVLTAARDRHSSVAAFGPAAWVLP